MPSLLKSIFVTVILAASTLMPWAASTGHAQAGSSITGLSHAALPGGEVEIRLQYSGALSEPQVFTTDEPPRIALDFPGAVLDTSVRTLNIASGATKSASVVEAGGRTRLVIDLFRNSPYVVNRDGNAVLVRIGNGFPVGQAASSGGRVTSAAEAVRGPVAAPLAVKSIDFRRGKGGEGRVMLSFSGPGANADLRREGTRLVLSILNASLPSELERTFDVADFATPVTTLRARRQPSGALLEVSVNGDIEQMAYQAGTEYVIEVAPKREPEGKRRAGDPPVYTGQRVTFNFQDIPVRSVLQLVADVSELNIVVADNVTGNVTLRLVNTPWDQALDIILQAKGLDKRRNGNVIWVAPTEEIAKREQALEDARIALEERQELISDVIPINYARAEEIARLLTTESLTGNVATNEVRSRGFLSPRGSVSYDNRTNTLLVNDTPPRVAQIRELVGLLDRPVQQVLIESRIVVANETFSRELGARFGVSGAYEDNDNNVINFGGSLLVTDQMANNALDNRLNNRESGLPVGTSGQRGSNTIAPSLPNRLAVNLPAVGLGATSYGFTILGNDYLLDLELSALQNEQRGDIISNPRVITASQQEAVIKQGVQIPIERTQSQNGVLVTVTEFKDAVLELKVTPTISPDQRVFLSLQVKQDSIAGTAPNGEFIIATRSVDTRVLVDNGQTVVLGGILERTRQSATDKVPVLGDIPAVGTLFRNKSKRDEKQELLIFVTPKILNESLR